METRFQTALIFDKIFRCLDYNDFEAIKNILILAPLTYKEGQLLVAHLSATNPWKLNPIIKQVREDLVSTTEEILLSEVGKERTHNILKGLR